MRTSTPFGTEVECEVNMMNAGSSGLSDTRGGSARSGRAWRVLRASRALKAALLSSGPRPDRKEPHSGFATMARERSRGFAWLDMPGPISQSLPRKRSAV